MSDALVGLLIAVLQVGAVLVIFVVWLNGLFNPKVPRRVRRIVWFLTGIPVLWLAWGQFELGKTVLAVFLLFIGICSFINGIKPLWF